MKRDDIRPLLEGLAPLEEAGKLSGVLCQFPWRFKNTDRNRAYLAGVREDFGGVPVFVEFRHNSWIKEPVFDFLAKQGLLYVSVDEPELPGLVPRIGRVTGEAGYLRFHSRRKQTWWAGGGKARYDYDYSEQELAEWIAVLEDLAERAQKIFVFFNNCHSGQAARNAEAMKGLLRNAGLLR